MSARKKIADLPWWSMPSSTDEEAKERTSEMLDAFAAEERAATLREAIAAAQRQVRHWHTTVRCDGCAAALRFRDALRELAAAGQAPAPDAEPDFFQVGRTYTRGATPWKAPELIEVFRPEHITVHPEHGFRRAIGWVRTGEPGAKWHGHFVDEAEFSEWTETRGAES